MNSNWQWKPLRVIAGEPIHPRRRIKLIPGGNSLVIRPRGVGALEWLLSRSHEADGLHSWSPSSCGLRPPVRVMALRKSAAPCGLKSALLASWRVKMLHSMGDALECLLSRSHEADGLHSWSPSLCGLRPPVRVMALRQAPTPAGAPCASFGSFPGSDQKQRIWNGETLVQLGKQSPPPA